MSKAENRHFTKVWKKRRKDYYGDRCRNAKCFICAFHKRFGNTKKFFKKSQRKQLEKIKSELNES